MCLKPSSATLHCHAAGLTLTLTAGPALTADLVGVPRVVDGDTVEIAGTKVRLKESMRPNLGIGAPATPHGGAQRGHGTGERSSALLGAASAGGAPSAACTIKGNMSRAGECIYHELGGRRYAKINMDPAKGKRWFCSEAKAKAVGCRKAIH
jgi:hypothetical protein